MATHARFLSSVRVIAGLTLLSRLLGLARECLFGYFFGTGELLSAYRIAFQVPNLARRLFGEGALSSAMIPVLTKTLQTDGEDASRKLVGSILVSLVLVLAGGIVAGEIVVAAWGFFSGDAALSMTALLLPYAAMICTVAVIGGVLNVRGHFATPAAVPCILNLAVIVSVTAGAMGAGLDDAGMMRVVCYAVLGAGVLQLLVSLFMLRKLSFFPIFANWRGNAKLREVMGLMAPMALGLSAVQINTLADNLIAYWFVEIDGEQRGPAILSFAHFLYQLPLGVFGIAIATAIFPVLTKCATEGDRAGLAHVFERGVRTSLFLAIPASVGLAFVAQPLIAALYQHGDFKASDTVRCSAALMFYSFGLAAYFTQHVVIRTFYAQHNSRTPARVALIMVAVNLAMNLALVQVMEESGLALATAICAFLQVAVLLVLLRPNVPGVRWMLLGKSLARTLVSTAVMGIALTATVAFAPISNPLIGHPVARVVVMVAVGVAAFGITAKIMRQEELAELVHRK